MFVTMPVNICTLLAKPIWQHLVTMRYPHELNVICTFVDGKLRLVAENDYHSEGLNLMDEFLANICALVELQTAASSR